MADKVVNIKVCSPLKLQNYLTGNYYAICHYSYNLPSDCELTSICLQFDFLNSVILVIFKD